jgi:antibiotic biosynthesis monooxygenase (ABM) superfamily enzyme
MSQESFWLNNFSVLFRKDKIFNVWFHKNQTPVEKLNAITRLVIYMTILGFMITKSMKIILSGLVTLIVIVILHKYQAKNTKHKKIKSILKEGFTNPEFYNVVKSNFTQPTKENPLMNVMLTD